VKAAVIKDDLGFLLFLVELQRHQAEDEKIEYGQKKQQKNGRVEDDPYPWRDKRQERDSHHDQRFAYENREGQKDSETEKGMGPRFFSGFQKGG
jgi:hypothetical protein